MGTSPISNLVNDFNLINVDIPQNNESTGEFAKTFENASQNGDIEKIAAKGVNVVDELKPADNVKENYLKETNGRKFEKKIESNDNKVSKTKETKTNVSVKETDEAVSEEETINEAVAGLINAYAEALGISPEDMMNFMEENNISVTDLLDPSKVQAIVMELNGITDSVDILTDDSLFESIKSIEELTSEEVKNLSEELGIDEKDLKSFIDEALKTVEKEAAPANAADDNNVKEEINNLKVNENDNELSSIETANTAEVKKTDSGNKSSNERSSDNNSAGLNTFASTESPLQVNEQLQGVSGENTVFSTDAQRIYDQIGEYIRNLSTETINEVQLKLEPETLGTIQVRVTQSEGLMKAELVTNNENVRAILEGQLIQLKEDFDHSGIRVDQVEVRVSTNEFNENAQQESRDEANERAARETARRNINISDGIELDEVEEYEDDEKIAVEMMAANGNTMDYRA
ncbi:MAG: flagellar hook-length control protein FliK [Lachnospiraceae bacterium]|nr:flagellar hook-length control protein FliK [Lachnospiraceae bacterium]